MNANLASTPENAPAMGPVKVRPLWVMLLYVFLVASAGLGLWARTRASSLSPALANTAPWLFLAFAVGFTAYRLALVMARRYSPFKAFLQIALAAFFFMLLLLPNGGARAAGPTSLDADLASTDARVRALAAEVAGFRHSEAVAPKLVTLLADPDAQVQAAAHEALVRLNDGADLGLPSQPEARSKWKERFP